jgi:hypothetical protein
MPNPAADIDMKWDGAFPMISRYEPASIAGQGLATPHTRQGMPAPLPNDFQMVAISIRNPILSRF